ncbi:MAG TPA: pirin family protein [Microlunatus sp.]|nr:pirin family protein [Microlunatus sp.]
MTAVPGRTSWHAFSFGEHYDPNRIGFGPLMVCNTDLVEIDHGYPDHPHRDAEIITWVLSGSLRHTDSFGHTGIVHPGLAQRMSAGTGIVHAEVNDAYRIDPDRPVAPVHFLQLWLRPDTPGSPPGYAQDEVTDADLRSGLVPIMSGRRHDVTIGLGVADATLWAARPDPGATLGLPDAPLLHLIVGRGEVDLEGAGRLRTGDTAELTGRGGSVITAISEVDLLVWEFGR